MLFEANAPCSPLLGHESDGHFQVSSPHSDGFGGDTQLRNESLVALFSTGDG